MKRMIWVLIFLVIIVVVTMVLKQESRNANTIVVPAVETVAEVSSAATIKETIMNNEVTAVIDGQSYRVILEENEAAQALRELLPLELTMQELNGNEKFAYLSQSLPTQTFKPGKLVQGDLMLYGDDCVVIFYQSLTSNYSYTRLGQVLDLPDLGTGEVKVRLQ